MPLILIKVFSSISAVKGGVFCGLYPSSPFSVLFEASYIFYESINEI
jgi:hypothetical protein